MAITMMIDDDDQADHREPVPPEPLERRPGGRDVLGDDDLVDAGTCSQRHDAGTLGAAGGRAGRVQRAAAHHDLVGPRAVERIAHDLPML